MKLDSGASVVAGLPLAILLVSACAVAPPSTASSGGDAGANSDASRASLVTTNGYVTAGTWMGYGFTATDPGAAIIVPDCGGAAGCVPAFSGSDFCMHGTVTGRADYTGFAMLGWNVNQQATTGASMDLWSVPDTGGSVTITVANSPSSTALRVQLQGTNPHDSADRWCAPLVSGQPIKWTDFRTNCYPGGTPQNALTANTMIQQAAVLVPGLQTDLPFDLCLINIEIK